ncbi:hypothetical protein PsYK624_077260 [Phanerochaete sordida]|uniref:Uncharacterized protein n=1 Tax=Phanerochaete sordida TaxID=48140 RepID=A0A9P3GB76_9APHY|nr:hypothetical protein PsYK624_077260 [Phanerochaete sordida]
MKFVQCTVTHTFLPPLPRLRFGIHRPVLCTKYQQPLGSDIAVTAANQRLRHPHSAEAVWSRSYRLLVCGA